MWASCITNSQEKFLISSNQNQDDGKKFSLLTNSTMTYLFYFVYSHLRIEIFEIQCRHLPLDILPQTTSDFISCPLLTLHLLRMHPNISKLGRNLGTKAKCGIDFTSGFCYFVFSSMDSLIACLFSNIF